MKNLIALIVKYHFTLLYLILQIAATMLLINLNDYHKTTWFNSSNLITGYIYNKNQAIKDYLSLKIENEKLNTENALLNKLIYSDPASYANKWKETKGLTAFCNYEFIHGRAINKSINRKNNFITINKGLKNGIKPEMGIIAPNGVVGIVRDVSNYFATVIPIINTNSHISAKIKNSDFFGTISWDAKDYRYALLNEIPFHVNINKGDIIETSGFSAIFPQGIKIGYVESVEQGDDNYFLYIRIRLSVDFMRVNNIIIVNNKLRNEQLEIERDFNND